MSPQPLARPIADLHLVVGVDLIEVQDVEAIGNRQARGLARGLDQRMQMRPHRRDQRATRKHRGGDLDHPATDSVAAARLHLLDHAELLERRQHPRHGALGQVDPIGDVGDARRPARQAAQHGERPLDGLNR